MLTVELECGVWRSGGVRSVESRWSVRGVCNVECNVECGVRSVEYGVWSVEVRLSVECEVQVECGVWSAGGVCVECVSNSQ